MRRLPLLVAGSALGVLIVATVVTAVTATNTVPPTRAGEDRRAIELGSLAPSECESIVLGNKVTGSGVLAGSAGNDWIIGSDGIDTIEALGGDDCIQGRGGNDIIDGGPGSDVCLGGGGNDTFVACETEIQ